MCCYFLRFLNNAKLLGKKLDEENIDSLITTSRPNSQFKVSQRAEDEFLPLVSKESENYHKVFGARLRLAEKTQVRNALKF